MTVERDILDEAVRALRETTAEEEPGHRFTRARVMASLHQGKVRRRTRLAFVLPLAASFVAASAWGVSSGKAQAFFKELGEAVGILPATPPTDDKPAIPKPRKGERQSAPKPAATEAPVGEEPPAEEEAPVEETPAPAEQKPEPSETKPAETTELTTGPRSSAEKPEKPAPRVTSSPTDPSPAPVTSAPDPELELYREAHRAHFQDQDTLRALGAWNRYLERHPNGRFALEARYNRALCLVRLGRKDEARAALAPFASGRYGGYREREANELIEALSK